MDINILSKYLKENFNNNIDWVKVLYKYDLNNLSKDNKLKLLKKIKSLSWIDKSDPIEGSEYNDYLKYYTELLLIKNVKHKKILIYDSSDNIQQSYLKNELKTRLKTLKSILKMRDIKYNISNKLNEINEYDYIILLTPLKITQEEANKIDINKLIYKDNNNYTIIKHNKNNKDILTNIYNLIHDIYNYIKYEDETNIDNKNNYIYIEE